jgi:hypothetical protein
MKLASIFPSSMAARLSAFASSRRACVVKMRLAQPLDRQQP